MKKNVKITVLISVYNTDFQLIKRALNSVLNQDGSYTIYTEVVLLKDDFRVQRMNPV